jgi:hypothetical protein
MIVQIGHPILVVLTAEDQISPEVPCDTQDSLARGRVLLEVKIYGVLRPKDEGGVCGRRLAREREIALEVRFSVFSVPA